MKTAITIFILGLSLFANFVRADTFGTGTNQFTIDFVTISGDASGANGIFVGNELFNDPGNDYRIAKYEVTNEQWNKFLNAYGTLTGNDSFAYKQDAYWTGINMPTNCVSFYEAAQFVNWLNVSSGYEPAYNFTGTQGTTDYTFVVWEPDDDGYDPSNPYRNCNTFFFLPTVDEWVKAAYWNGATLQTYSTIGDILPVAGVDINYNQIKPFDGPWNIGSGSEELNGTFDMMGNVWEITESPFGYFRNEGAHVIRGGSYVPFPGKFMIGLNGYDYVDAWAFYIDQGLRIASVVPEPYTVLLLGFGGVLVRRR